MNVEHALAALSWFLCLRAWEHYSIIYTSKHSLSGLTSIFPVCFLGTFSTSEGLDRCSSCTKCPSSVPMFAACTATQDTQCECDTGYFFMANYKLCAPCSKCSRGEGAIRECGPQGDTQCQVCGPGTFSEEQRTTKPCQTCTKCSDNEVEIRACMPNSDTLCMGEF